MSWDLSMADRAAYIKIGLDNGITHKRRLSDAHRGNKEWRDKIGRDKIGKAHKGKIVSQETKDKMSAIMKSKHIKLSEERKRISRSNKGKVISDKHTGEIIREYSSMTEASKYTGIYYGSINKCCNNITKSAGGYKWRLKYDK